MALPWNVNDVETDAREMALEAARRQGKSLGQWLSDVIGDHAAVHGLAPRQLDGRERIEAVTARLELMSGAAERSEAQRMRRRGQSPPEQGGSGTEDTWAKRHVAAREATSRRSARDRAILSERVPIDDDADLLDDAVHALDQRAARSQGRTAAALTSVPKLREDSQAERGEEYGSVADLSRKLGELEATMGPRRAADAGNPVAGSLARLEARLDAVARRGAAEAAARQHAGSAGSDGGKDALRQLEAKLNTILAAVSPSGTATAASAAAMAAGRAAPAGDRRGLGEAIAEISRRQRTLEEPAGRTGRAVAEADASHPMSDGTLAALRAEMASLVSTMEGMRRDALFARQARPTPDAALDALRSEIAGMVRTLEDLASRPSIETLEHAVATLADRIDASRERGIREHVLRPVETAMDDLRHALHALDPRDTIAGLEDELHRIAAKVDGLGEGDGRGFVRLQSQMEEMRAAIDDMASRPSPTERIEAQVAALAAALDRSLARDDGRSATAAALSASGRATSAGFDAIGHRIDQLAERLDQVLAGNMQPAPANDDTHNLERLVQDLALRFEAAQVPDDGAALDALQRQIEQLSSRFERSEGELAVLPDLAASMRHLFENLEATRASVEVTAARAAREVLKIAVEDGARASAAADPRDSRAAANSATLDTVHAMLGKVVDRLGTVEREIAVARRPVEPVPAPASREPSMTTPHPVRARAPQPVIPAPQTTRASPQGMRPAPESREIRLGGAEPRLGTPPAMRTVETPAAEPNERLRAVPTDDNRRGSDYIAAARRAAAAAQAEAAAAQRQMPAMKAARAGLLVRSRDYVATHKRPMLMGLAAIMMALGAMALVGRFGDAGAPQLASASDASKITVAARGAPALPEATLPSAPREGGLDKGALSPSALPKPAMAVAATIPGSDPIATGSLPSLPAFAAGAALAPPRPSLPHALVAAAESGDPAAQYDLATRYAEGRQVSRDMKRAAILFEKAADTGLAPAEYRLAALYEKGIGVPLDKTKAKALYAKAAAVGNPRAMHNLAVLLADNDGQPDYPAAIGWFRKAAQFGVHDSQYNLAVLLGKGLGAPQNLVQSYQWFAVAAAANDTDAEKKRDEVGTKLSANDLGVAKALAAAFQAKAPDASAVDVVPPPGGWDGASGSSRLNSARSKISSL